MLGIGTPIQKNRFIGGFRNKKYTTFDGSTEYAVTSANVNIGTQPFIAFGIFNLSSSSSTSYKTIVSIDDVLLVRAYNTGSSVSIYASANGVSDSSSITGLNYDTNYFFMFQRYNVGASADWQIKAYDYSSIQNGVNKSGVTLNNIDALAYIGRAKSDIWYFWGNLDEIGIAVGSKYNTLLTDSEIIALAGTSPQKSPDNSKIEGALAMWHMGDKAVWSGSQWTFKDVVNGADAISQGMDSSNVRSY